MNMMILGLIRHALTTLGGGLVANGALSGDELNITVGAITALVGVIWSVIEKRQRVTR